MRYKYNKELAEHAANWWNALPMHRVIDIQRNPGRERKSSRLFCALEEHYVIDFNKVEVRRKCACCGRGLGLGWHQSVGAAYKCLFSAGSFKWTADDYEEQLKQSRGAEEGGERDTEDHAAAQDQS